MRINTRLTAQKLQPKIERLFELSAQKILSLERRWEPANGTPVVTARGKYVSRAWTDWTQGFQFGSALLQFDATGERRFLELGRRKTIQLMGPHVSNMGVHDHGFNNISTYGNLWRVMREGKLPFNEHENDLYELALKVSGAVQAARWTKTADGGGYIYSFNGPHSLFVDTVRSLRSLAVAHQLGHVLRGERDRSISLLHRLLDHAETTALYSVYYGKGRDAFDVRGRTAHESIFNINDGSYRAPNSQQGYSSFGTWMRGLAWAILGFAEQLEFLETLNSRKTPSGTLRPIGSPDNRAGVPRDLAASRALFLDAARATADFYIANSCADGIPMWDSGAPNLHRLGAYLGQPADPYNRWEPVDSSAAAIAAQGLLRLGNYLQGKGDEKSGERYRQAGLTVANTLFDEPYLSLSPEHEGLLLHSVYHLPNGWDYVAAGQKVPNGESSMWGDYHARELALLLLREARCDRYFSFFVAGG
ncbi:MAG TPA: glycosyl hydrolase [Candidatus Paceibacterota bacterium]|nr:glycosyl hydrolase [Verrucomicrobiota bacterium]HSA11910.1 glycosyl hydrolase [Candidatus Paceibacterota bacterium]